MKQKNCLTRGFGKKLGLSACVCAFLALTLLFFTPSDILLANSNEFHFTYAQVWQVLVALAVGAAAILTGLLCLLPLKAAVLVNLCLFAVGLCSYVQSMFLNGQMKSLTGELIVYEKSLVYGNLAVWFCLIAVVLALYFVFGKIGKKKVYRHVVIYLSLCLIVMQAVPFVLTLTAVHESKPLDSSVYLSNEGEWEVSAEKNTVVFLVDTCDDAYFEEALAQYPDALEGYDGFVYYPDCTSTHSRTYPSVPYMLTGQLCYFDRPFSEFCEYAHENSTFLKEIHETGCHVGLYTETAYVGSASYDAVDNLYTGQVSEQRMVLPAFVKVAAKMAMLRNAPYCFKNRFLYSTNKVNQSFVRADMCIQQDDRRLYTELTQNGLTASASYDQAFRFYHLWGAHPGVEYNENFEPGSDGSAVIGTRASLRLIRVYLDQLKTLGVYENTTVIVTADHGSSDGSSAQQPLVIGRAPRCLMLVKPAGVGSNTVDTADDEAVTASDAPVSHADLFATILQSVGADSAAYGKTIFEYAPDEPRTRLYYNTALYDDIDGEVALREYAVTGDSRDFSNWHLTGRNWDVLYSERAVSKHRLSEVYAGE